MAEAIELGTVYAPSENVVYREIEGEAVIAPIMGGVGDAEGVLYSLNETGKIIWALLDGERSLAETVDAVCEEFDAPREAVVQDVLGFIAALAERDIVAPVTGS